MSPFSSPKPSTTTSAPTAKKPTPTNAAASSSANPTPTPSASPRSSAPATPAPTPPTTATTSPPRNSSPPSARPASSGLDIVGFYHSHPDHPAQWSPTDFAEAHWFGCAYVITAVAAQGKAALTNSLPPHRHHRRRQALRAPAHRRRIAKARLSALNPSAPSSPRSDRC